MSKEWAIRLPLDEKADAPILVRVRGKTPTSLDLDLLATDGDAAFEGKGIKLIFP